MSSLRQRATGLNAGVHQLNISGMFGKKLYEAEIDIPDNTITYVAWERGEIKVLKTEWLEDEARPRRSRPDRGHRRRGPDRLLAVAPPERPGRSSRCRSQPCRGSRPSPRWSRSRAPARGPGRRSAGRCCPPSRPWRSRRRRAGPSPSRRRTGCTSRSSTGSTSSSSSSRATRSRFEDANGMSVAYSAE